MNLDDSPSPEKLRVMVISRNEKSEEWMREHLLERMQDSEPQLDLDSVEKISYEWSKHEAITRYEGEFRVRSTCTPEAVEQEAEGECACG